MMNKRLLLIGGGGHCRSVLDSVSVLNEFSDIGVIDSCDKIGTQILGVPIIGCDGDLTQLFDNGYKYAFVTVGSIGDPRRRVALFERLCEIGFEIPSVVDSSSVVSCHAKLGKGVFVGKNAVINAGSRIQEGSIVNTGAIIEHDCLIGKFVHIAPGSVLCGEVQIGANTHIGAKTVVKQRLTIGSDSIVGVGSVVSKNIKSNVIAYGNPCKEVRKR